MRFLPGRINRQSPSRITSSLISRRQLLELFKWGSAAALTLRFSPGCGGNGSNIDPEECGIERTEALDAYANRIRSETFLGNIQVGPDDRIIFPSGSSYIGMFLNDGDPDLNRVDLHTCLTGKNLALVKSFWAFARGFDFPTDVARSIQQRGGTLFLALEPWSWNGAGDNSFSLTDINAGIFDAELSRFLQGAANFREPLIFSFMHEFNGDWYPWAGDPPAFVSAWRRVHAIAQEVGATNVHWAWIMNAETVNSPVPEEFYPGDDVVDITGVDGFNFGNAFAWSNWRSFSEIFTSPYGFLRNNFSNKPVIIGEYGTAASSQGGDQAVWIDNALATIDPRDSGNLPFRASIYFNMIKEAQFALYSMRQPIMNQTQLMGQIAQLRSNPDARGMGLFPVLL